MTHGNTLTCASCGRTRRRIARRQYIHFHRFGDGHICHTCWLAASALASRIAPGDAERLTNAAPGMFDWTEAYVGSFDTMFRNYAK